MQAKEARKDREAALAKAEMTAALSRGVSWGMGPEDANVSAQEQSDEAVDWRTYSMNHVSPAVCHRDCFFWRCLCHTCTCLWALHAGLGAFVALAVAAQRGPAKAHTELASC